MLPDYTLVDNRPPSSAVPNSFTDPAEDSVRGDGADEFHHAGIFEIDIDLITPAVVNDVIYKPVSPHDPDTRAFAERLSQADPSFVDPIVITLDRVVISGHRRRAAYLLLGRKKILVRQLPILSTDEQFPAMLAGFNDQREKTADEVFREALVRLNPTDAHRRLVEHRRQAVAVKVQALDLVGVKTRAAISEAKLPFLKAICHVVNRNREYWPLSDRLIHYQLLNNPPLKHAGKGETCTRKLKGQTERVVRHNRYCNDDESYNALTELLTRARLEEYVPFEAIHDPTRPVNTWTVFPGASAFIRQELEGFLRCYWRDLQRSQPLHVEIVGEKNTVEGILRPVAMEFTIPLTISRGYSSIPPRADMVRRFRRGGKDKLLILFVSDCDPEGDDIAHSFARSIRDDFGVENVEAVRVALTREQAVELDLPPLAVAKIGSSRRKGYVERHRSEHVWELEAMPPAVLQQILREQIAGVLDMDLFRREESAEATESRQLEAVRATMRTYFINNFADLAPADGADSGTVESDREGGVA